MIKTLEGRILDYAGTHDGMAPTDIDCSETEWRMVVAEIMIRDRRGLPVDNEIVTLYGTRLNIWEYDPLRDWGLQFQR